MSVENGTKKSKIGQVEQFTVDELEKILSLLKQHEVMELRLERGDDSLWVRRGALQEVAVINGTKINEAVSVESRVASDVSLTLPVEQYSEISESEGGARLTPKKLAEVKDDGLIEIKSPMVGTFYRRPAVDADPYVHVGDIVKKGQVICIVEAMKLMNEIESTDNGEIVEICLEDAQMVEYGEVLFRLRKSL